MSLGHRQPTGSWDDPEVDGRWESGIGAASHIRARRLSGDHVPEVAKAREDPDRSRRAFSALSGEREHAWERGQEVGVPAKPGTPELQRPQRSELPRIAGAMDG